MQPEFRPARVDDAEGAALVSAMREAIAIRYPGRWHAAGPAVVKFGEMRLGRWLRSERQRRASR
ncbi:MAG: hypothetical protein M3Y66_09575 [Actinomycetota bacterium]|nr:hypothetical protein [Actinomycetota bacterium]